MLPARPVATTTRRQSSPSETPHPVGTWLTAPEIAAHLGVSLRTISTWTAAGQIPCVRLPGRIVRFDREAVDAWARGLAQTSSHGVRHGGRR
ncbi:MAG: helix-turn-helix domain-containing protein [Acidimicrobiales bacterium]